MSIVDTWDDPQTGADWDSGLQWDVNTGNPIGDVSPYLNLVTSEHNQRPKFMAMLAYVMQPIADDIAVLRIMNGKFDVDSASGDQLDVVGKWVGAARNVSVPLTGIYFTLGNLSLGFGSGTWFSLFDPLSGLVILPDEDFRTLIRAKIANNQWDGTIPGAYAVWDTLFTGTGISILIQDLGNMHMIYALTGNVPSAVTLALFRQGYLDLKPEGVKIDAYLTPSVPDIPYFGFGVENSSISGFGVGAWGLI